MPEFRRSHPTQCPDDVTGHERRGGQVLALKPVVAVDDPGPEFLQGGQDTAVPAVTGGLVVVSHEPESLVAAGVADRIAVQYLGHARYRRPGSGFQPREPDLVDDLEVVRLGRVVVIDGDK